MRAITVMGALASIACSDGPVTGHEHADVFRVAVAIGPDEIAPGFHLPINGGHNNPIHFNLYDEHGRRMTTVDHFQLTVSFTPSDLAAATPVAGSTTRFNITSSAPPETAGTMTVSVYHPHTLSTKSFGPYDVLVH
jgi:hypothetical protein